VPEPPLSLPKSAKRSGWRPYAVAAGVTVVSSLIFYLLSGTIDYRAIALFLIFTVTLMSLWLERGPVFLAAALSALLWNFLFIPPLFTFSIARLEDLLILVMYFIIAIVTGILTSRIREKEKALRLREERALVLYAMSFALANADSIDSIARIATGEIGRALDADVALILKQEDRIEVHPAGTYKPDDDEIRHMRRLIGDVEAAGPPPSERQQPGVQYRSLITPRQHYGILGVRLRGRTAFREDQKSLLENLVSQTAAAIERESLHEQRRQIELAASTERFYKTLLNSISHELRTPLSVISGAAGSLVDKSLSLPEASRSALLQEIAEASGRLDGLVENLLDMSRLESGKVVPKREWCDIADLYSELKRRYKQVLSGHRAEFTLMPESMLVYIDSGLMEQAVGNLIENAAKYAPPHTVIRIDASLAGSDLIITVKDQGPGFPEEAIPHLFTKFYRVPGTAPGGTGLGLSISKGFVECIQGSITAQNHPDGGALLTIRLPVSIKPIELEEWDE